MALILSIETGTEVCSVALAKDGEMISLRESSGEGRAHANHLALYIEEVLRGNDMDADELDAVAVGGGPGSYTGLRIGVSTAKGMCYALGKPLIAVDSLQALASIAMEEVQAGIVHIGNPETAVLAPMIDARRMEVYTRLFDTGLRPDRGAYPDRRELCRHSGGGARTAGLRERGAEVCRAVARGDFRADRLVGPRAGGAGRGGVSGG